jgi:hypothetical protein
VANALELLHILKPAYRPTLPACLTAAFPRLADWAEVQDSKKAAPLFD